MSRMASGPPRSLSPYYIEHDAGVENLKSDDSGNLFIQREESFVSSTEGAGLPEDDDRPENSGYADLEIEMETLESSPILKSNVSLTETGSDSSSGLEDENFRFLPISSGEGSPGIGSTQFGTSVMAPLPCQALSKNVDDKRFLIDNLPPPLIRNFIRSKPAWNIQHILKDGFYAAWKSKQLFFVWLVLLGFIYSLHIFSDNYDDLTWRGWLALIVFFTEVEVLVANVLPPYFVFSFGMAFLYLCDVIDDTAAFAGFSNSGVLVISFLYVVAKTISETKVLRVFCSNVLKYPRTTQAALLRTLPLLCMLSSVCNNTALMSMSTSVLSGWSKQCQIPVPQILMPVNFMVTVGGSLTIIGGSAAVVAYGLAQNADPSFHMNIFSIGMVSGPVSICCLIFLLLFSSTLLPEKISPAQSQVAPFKKEFCTIFYVTRECVFVGRKISETPIMDDGAFVMQVVTADGQVISRESANLSVRYRNSAEGISRKTREVDVEEHIDSYDDEADSDDEGEDPSEHMLSVGDVLYIVAPLAPLIELSNIVGFALATRELSKVDATGSKTVLVEAVISALSPLTLGSTTRSAFRERYNAAILGFYRPGSLFFVDSDLTPFKLQTNDVLLMEVPRNFSDQAKIKRDFSLIKIVRDASTIPTALSFEMVFVSGTFLLMILLVSAQLFDILRGAIFLNVLYISLGLITFPDAIASIDWKVFLTIASAIATSNALDMTNAAAALSETLLAVFSKGGTLGVLFGLFVICLLLTSVLTNTVTVALVFPIAWEFATQQDISEQVILYVLIIGSCTSFLTPFAYQTNLMVNQIVPYTQMDYLKVGGPLALISLLVTTLMCYALA